MTLPYVEGITGPILPDLTLSSALQQPMGDNSDMPQDCLSSQPSLFFIVISVSYPNGAAPLMIHLRDEKSYSSTMGCFAKATRIGGTSCARCG